MGEFVKDVTDASFDHEVLQQSQRVPVVIDFWAPWCAPCGALGPVLERLAEEYAGAFVLAKINVDENPGAATAFGIRGIPAVKAVHRGEIVDEFVGALPEPAVRQFLGRILPTDSDRLTEEGSAAERRGDRAAAEALYRQALEGDPNQPAARLGLGRLLSDSDPEVALVELDRVLPATAERTEADRIAARLRLGRENGAGDAELRTRLDREPNDLDARLRLARLLAARQDYEGALAHLLEIVKRDRSYDDESGRKSMLDIFQILGSDHPLTEKYRSELARVLFS
jgi:putative thioredoxin